MEESLSDYILKDQRFRTVVASQAAEYAAVTVRALLREDPGMTGAAILERLESEVAARRAEMSRHYPD